MSFVVAHVSDLHVSEFGDTFHDRLRIVKRSANIAAVDAGKYDIVWEEAGWRVIHERGKRQGKVGLVDPQGYLHPIPNVKESGGTVDPIERAVQSPLPLEISSSTRIPRSSVRSVPLGVDRVLTMPEMPIVAR